MGICVPRHVECDWYSPKDGSPPGFIAGADPCVLPLFSESKSRLEGGGTLFRSVDIGEQTNTIQVSSTWRVLGRDYNAGAPDFDSLTDIDQVKLVITHGAIIETYFANQSYTGPLGDETWNSGIPSLRSQLSSSQLAVMPTIDLETNGTGAGGTWDATFDDADHLSQFSSSSLSGGISGPTSEAALRDIRTGPAFTMIYIDFSEKNTNDGSKTFISETRYWNGACYKGYNPLNPDCSAGSPPDCNNGVPVCP